MINYLFCLWILLGVALFFANQAKTNERLTFYKEKLAESVKKQATWVHITAVKKKDDVLLRINGIAFNGNYRGATKGFSFKSSDTIYMQDTFVTKEELTEDDLKKIYTNRSGNEN